MNGERLLHSIQSGHAPHAVLITGPAGVGRRALARRAAALFCLSEDAPERLGRCPDYTEVSGDGVSVAEIRALTASTNVRSFTGGGKAYLVTDAHLMGPDAQNALLKTLEEPPSGTMLLLTGAEAGLLPTIRSRCAVERLGAMSVAALERRLTGGGMDAQKARVLAAFADGIPGVAEEYAAEEAFALRLAALDALDGLLLCTPPMADIAGWTAKKRGDEDVPYRKKSGFRNARMVAAVWESMLHDALLASVGAPGCRNLDRTAQAAKFATHFTASQIEDMIEILAAAQQMLYEYANPQFALDTAAAQILCVVSGAKRNKE